MATARKEITSDVAVNSTEQVDVNCELCKGAIYTIGGISAIVGIWAIACFIGAMVSSGGTISLAESWISALTGM